MDVFAEQAAQIIFHRPLKPPIKSSSKIFNHWFVRQANQSFVDSMNIFRILLENYVTTTYCVQGFDQRVPQ